MKYLFHFFYINVSDFCQTNVHYTTVIDKTQRKKNKEFKGEF